MRRYVIRTNCTPVLEYTSTRVVITLTHWQLECRPTPKTFRYKTECRIRTEINNNNNPICKAPECQKTSVALKDFRGMKTHAVTCSYVT